MTWETHSKGSKYTYITGWQKIAVVKSKGSRCSLLGFESHFSSHQCAVLDKILTISTSQFPRVKREYFYWPVLDSSGCHAKYYRLGDLTKRNLFSYRSEDLESQDQDASLVRFWQDLSFWLAESHLLIVCSHNFSAVCMCEEEELSVVSPSKGTNPIMRASPIWPHLNLVSSQGPASKYYHIGD